jgi:hypothetical protein
MGLQQLVQKPTRGRIGNEDRLLDLILTSNPDIVSNILHEPLLGCSDHDVLLLHIDVDQGPEHLNGSPACPSFSYDRANYDAIRQAAKNQITPEKIPNRDVQEAWDNLKHNLCLSNYFVQ